MGKDIEIATGIEHLASQSREERAGLLKTDNSVPISMAIWRKIKRSAWAGVNFVLITARTAEGRLAADEAPTVTLSLSNASALDLLKAVMEQTRHTHKISGSVVTVYRNP